MSQFSNAQDSAEQDRLDNERVDSLFETIEDLFLAQPPRASARYAVIDLETTGVDTGSDAIVEIAAALCEDGRIIDTFQTLVNPGRSIPAEATAVHHIRDRNVIGAPSRTEAVSRLTDFVRPAHVLVAHNAAFDSSFLPDLIGRPWVCTLRLAKHLVPHAPNFKNQTLRYFLGIDDELHGDLGSTAHSALADVRVTAGILFRLLRELRAREGSRPVSWLLNYANSPATLLRMPRGDERSRGKLFSQLTDRDLSYWLGRNDCDPDLVWTLRQEVKRRALRLREAS